MQDDYYKNIGLKAGLEVHQQLNTKKLFIGTISELSDESDLKIIRKLRPVSSELGEFDATALDAFNRNETFIYHANKNNISLIELDDEPPKQTDEKALETVLEVALMTNSKPVDESIIMRKTVIDGSNTSAFQRTMLISIGGEIKINNDKKIGIETIILEEDAARNIEKEKGIVNYNLDRLGIPLIELATAPDITTPKEAFLTAKKIGEIMRLTANTKRGKGTIRQDINVSIKEGERCEIKGCQELDLIETIVKKEIKRQIDLIELKKELNKKIKNKDEIFSDSKIIDLLNTFKNTNCKFIKKNVFGFKLKKLKGVLGKEIGDRRFGSELGDYAKASGVGGLIHRDELPNYGISEKEIEDVCTILNCKQEDNFVIIVDTKEKVIKAKDSIKNRIEQAFNGVVKETRTATLQGASVYQRPLAGGARMYPETDLFSKQITKELINKIKNNLPKSIEERENIYKKLGLKANHINEMKMSNYARFFEELTKEGANPVVCATFLLQNLTELRREGENIKKLTKKEIKEILLLEKNKKINKNELKEITKKILKGENIEDIINNQTQNNVSTKEIEKIIVKIVKNNYKLVKEKKLGAIGPLMGDLMKEKKIRNFDGQKVSALLKKEIQKMI